MTIKSLYPASRPALGIDFAKTKRLDPRVAFTRASVGTFVDNGGVIRTAASGVARFNHTGTGESLGLLVEPAKINDHWYSNTFSFSNPSGSNPPYWQTSGSVTLQEQQHPDPAGGNTATRIIPTTASSTHSISRYSLYYAETYAHSFFVKPQGYSRITVNINGAVITINLSTKTSSGGNSITYFDKIEELANGWLRVTCTWFAGSGGAFQGANGTMPVISILDDSGNATFAGDGVKGIDIYGFQREVGTTSSSYIATGGGQATRAADVATLSNANSSIFPTSAFTTVNTPFGTAGGGSTVKLVGPTIKRTAIYAGDLPQAQINTLTSTGDFWRWRVLGSTFALPNFTTDGSVTVDWGDGTVQTLTTAVRTFANGGGYHDIGFRLNSGTFFKPNINGNATYKDRVIAVGPAPASMKVNGGTAFHSCAALRQVDGYADYSVGTDFYAAFYNNSSLVSFPFINTTGVSSMISSWQNCSSLTSFPLINTASVTNFLDCWGNCGGLTSFPLINTGAGTNFQSTWSSCAGLTSFPLINIGAATTLPTTWSGCSSLTSFPLINTGNVTSFSSTWANCSSLTSFPLINTGAATSLYNTWFYCSALTSFPLINTANVTSLSGTWYVCSSLTSFPLINTSNVTNFQGTWLFNFALTSFPAINTGAGTNFHETWRQCVGLTSFPALNFASATTFRRCWENCSILATFPANLFNTTGTLASDAFADAFINCALTATSIENILTSLVTNGQSNITLSLQGGSNAGATTWTTAANTAYATLITRGWTITRKP